MLYLYNTISKSVRQFRPLNRKRVLYYTCGPSVYNFAHIGNLRTFFWEDVLHRVLLFNGYDVVRAMPISDIEDKSIIAFKKQSVFKSFKGFIDSRVRIFKRDMRKLGMLEPSFIVRFSDVVPQMISWIKKAIRKDLAYQYGKGNVFFDVSKCYGSGNYGLLYPINLKRSGIRMHDHYAVSGLYDFCLWKRSQKLPKGMSFLSPWSIGRPGSDPYCAVIIKEFLGSVIDIHAGGTDNKYPHHENEIAFSCVWGAGAGFVRYWFHVAHLTVNKKKMSKRLGNVVYLSDVESRGFSAQDLRFFYCTGRFCKTQNFNYDLLKEASVRRKALIKKLRAIMINGGAKTSDDVVVYNTIKKARQQIMLLMNNNVQISRAFLKFEKLVDSLHGKSLGSSSISALQALCNDIEFITGISLV